jgi:hypothetical protein
MKRHRKYTPSLGTVSHGTLRTEDLLPAFLDELCAVTPRKHGKLKREARREIARHERDNDNDEMNSEIVDDLLDALSEHAPPFMYFGTTEGDGSDFGWWPSWSEIDELPQFNGTGEAAAEKHFGEFKVVSDHGNVEIYVRHSNGHIKSLLGIV